MKLYVSHADRPSPRSGAGWWWETEYGQWRLVAELEAMRRSFPHFRTFRTQGVLCWEGVLASAVTPGKRYCVRMTYPHGFPDETPIPTIEAPRLHPDAPHLLDGNRPCLFRDGGREGYDPARTTAATLVAWTALWIHAYETWLETGRWPGRAA
jgi:hypothetical protein